jgi:DNA polymerase III epsilon subunit-like protein
MHRAPTLLALLLLSSLGPASVRAEQGPAAGGGGASRAAAIAEARALVARLRAPGQGALKPGQLARVRGLLVGSRPDLFGKPAAVDAPREESRDATYRTRHPMFQRLVAKGWFRREEKIASLQRLADGLRATRALPPTTPLAQAEFLVFDLEASGGSAGHFDRKRGKLLFGWDEVTQFGYTIYRGGRKVESGSIDIRPDVAIAPVVQRITGLDAAKLAGAARFEDVAERILRLMQGRVLVGQGSLRNDWSWLQSSFARLGVDIPGPRQLMLDTHVLSFHSFPQGAGLKDLVKHYGVESGRLHSAGYDAAATGAVIHAMLRERGAVTLGDAFRLQAQAQEIMHRPRPSAR